MIFEIMFALFIITGLLMVGFFAFMLFATDHKNIKLILFIIAVLMFVICAIGVSSLSITRSTEIIESNCIISNETIDALVDFNSNTGYGRLTLFGISYVINKDSISYIVIYGDKVETVYFGGYLRDPDTIRYANQYCLIYS
ncbi:MAG: hypothetical protein PHT24_06640 [Endomicrobiaceae bacterium]|nr:hypothetical protein [Endomicrobiaceae bacterium]